MISILGVHGPMRYQTPKTAPCALHMKPVPSAPRVLLGFRDGLNAENKFPQFGIKYCIYSLSNKRMTQISQTLQRYCWDSVGVPVPVSECDRNTFTYPRGMSFNLLE